jgi:hydroxymethylbilane synthase
VKARVLSFASLAAPLARSQTQAVIDRIQAVMPRVTCRLTILSPPPADSGRNQETFVAVSRSEVQYLARVLHDEPARLVVIEAADLPLPLPDGVEIVCVPDRATPYDAYLNRQGLIMDEMKGGGRIGVLSARSRSQMAGVWPELEFVILRGGVDKAMETHLRGSELDGLVIPAAVTEHLGIQGIVAEIFAPEFVLPSPGQGILVILGRTDDPEARQALAPLHSPDTAIELEAEQAFRSCMISDRDLPVGALAKVEGGEVCIVGTTGSGLNRVVVNGSLDEAAAAGAGLAQQILCSGESFADLLEAEFPEGLPDENDDPEFEGVGFDELMPDEPESDDDHDDLGFARGNGPQGASDEDPEEDDDPEEDEDPEEVDWDDDYD